MIYDIIKCLNGFIQTLNAIFKTRQSKKFTCGCGKCDGDLHGEPCGKSCDQFCDDEPFDYVCYNILKEKKICLNAFVLANQINPMHPIYLIDAFGGNVVADNVNGVFRHDNVFGLHLVNLCNGASVLILALHQQLVLVFTDSDDNRLVQ
jgi:hypothetical protein